MRFSPSLLALAFLSVTALAEDKKVTVNAGTSPALQLTVPEDVKVTTKGEKTTLQGSHLFIYLWHVPTAKTVADAIPHAATIIKSEFTDFAVKETKDQKVAGHDAKRLIGTGAEADDGDPGTAEVVLFTAGKDVFAACVHGERDEAAKEWPDLLKVLQSIKAL